jgi:hypothetical protein
VQTNTWKQTSICFNLALHGCSARSSPSFSAPPATSLPAGTPGLARRVARVRPLQPLERCILHARWPQRHRQQQDEASSLRHHAGDAREIDVIRCDVDHAEGRPVDQSCSGFGLRIRRSDGGKSGELRFSTVKIGIKNVTVPFQALPSAPEPPRRHAPSWICASKCPASLRPHRRSVVVASSSNDAGFPPPKCWPGSAILRARKSPSTTAQSRRSSIAIRQTKFTLPGARAEHRAGL